MVDVSVIIPIYGVEAYIDASLRSLFAQSKSEGVEYVLVNDATPDNSIEIVYKLEAEYPHLDIKIINQPCNGGVAAARQAGLEAAQGEYIFNFDPDDLCETEMIEQMHKCAIENDADIVVCDFVVQTKKGETYVKQSVPNSTEAAIRALLRGELHGALWNKLFRRSLFVEGDISFEKGINFMEDMLVSLKLFTKARSLVYLPKAYLYYVQNDSSIVAQFSQRKLDNAIAMTNCIERYFFENGISEKYARELIFRKAITKLFVLRYGAKEQQGEYAKLYGKLSQYESLARGQRLSLLCIESGNVWLYRLANNVYNLLKQIK